MGPGRVHPATVSGFNEATESVTVEWFENEETKGKELDVRHLAALNPAVGRALGTPSAVNPPSAKSKPVGPSSVHVVEKAVGSVKAAGHGAVPPKKPTPLGEANRKVWAAPRMRVKVKITVKVAVCKSPRLDLQLTAI